MMDLNNYVPRVNAIRNRFLDTKPDEDGMVELINCTFIADEPAIFGTPNDDWHGRELEWYLSQSLNVNDIKPPIPAIWKQVAAEDGTINSNYGWCIFSKENGFQFMNAVEAIGKKPATRQATMIYTRPSMHREATWNGRYDFICTNTVQLFLRDGKLIYIVNMRSSDAILGYKGDRAWHGWVQKEVVHTLKHSYEIECEVGDLIWNANSFHVYPRHVHLLKQYEDKMWEEGQI